MVQKIDDILEEVVPEFQAEAKRMTEKLFAKSSQPSIKREDLGIDESILFDLVSSDPVHIDELCSKSHFPSQKVSSLLLSMELKGAIQQRAGHFYTRTI